VTLELLKIPAVRAVAQRAGTAEEADDILGTQDSEFEVDLKPLHGEEAEFAQAAIRNALAQCAGVDFAVNTFLTERIEETLSGYTAAVVINLVGHDLDVLDRNAQEVASLLGRMPGATDIQVQAPLGTPQLAIRLRTAELARWGFDPVDVMEGVRTAYQGQMVGQVYEGNRVVDVVVILDPHKRRSVVDVRALPLRNSQGTYVRLSQLADLDETSGRYVVWR
jgi:Cu/Ag efflux pump CusA